MDQKKLCEASITIIEINNITVKCEVHSIQKTRFINIPRSLFNENIDVGMPFSLCLDDKSGHRKLSVKKRQLQEDLKLQGNREMSDLVHEF